MITTPKLLAEFSRRTDLILNCAQHKQHESTLTLLEQLQLFLKSATDHIKTGMADDEFEKYNFGDGVTVVDHDNWNTEDPSDYTKIVYVQFSDDEPDSDSRRLSFHVKFNENVEVSDSYALDMKSGSDVGSR